MKALHIEIDIERMKQAQNLFDFYDRLADFCRGIALNKSIKYLSFDQSLLDMSEIFPILVPLMSNLRSLELTSYRDSAEWLAHFLSSSSSSQLRQFELQCCGSLDDEYATNVITSLSTHHHNLRKLKLGNVVYKGKEWCVALGDLLKHPTLELEELIIHNDMDDIRAAILGDGLVNNKSLKKLSLNRMESITSIGWTSLARCWGRNSSIEELALSENEMWSENDEAEGATTAIATTLVTNTKLKCLDLSWQQTVDWRTFSDILGRSSSSVLEELNLSSTSMINDDLTAMVDGLAHISSLKTLHINGGQPHVTMAGWRTIPRLLEYPSSSLVEIHLSLNNINDDVIIEFANALVNNNTLEVLQLGRRNDITTRGWSNLANILCNKTNIESIIASNHTLKNVGTSSNHPNDLVSYLELNSNRAETVRQKIICYYFCYGECNMEALLDMGLSVLSHAVAWIGNRCIWSERDANAKLSLLYRLACCKPALFEFYGKAKCTTAVKRKRSEG